MKDAASLGSPAPSPERDSALAPADRLKRLAAIASLAVASLLIAAKAAAYFATGSVSLLSTLVDSLLDLAASFINFLAIRHAAQPADREHRFGHGKAEPLAGLGQAAFITGSAVFLLVQGGARLFTPEPVRNESLGVAVMILSIVLTLALVLFQRQVIRKTGSLAVGADALHYKSDLLVNLGVIGALVLSTSFGLAAADPLFAIGVAVYILYSSSQIFLSSYNLLMDRELPEEDRKRIKEIAEAHPAVISLHDLRTRSSGTQAFIQFHLEMDGNMSLIDAHVIAEQVMREVAAAFPGAEVLIHEDPYGIPEPRATFE